VNELKKDNEEVRKKQEGLARVLTILNYLFLSVIFCMNYIGAPSIKYIYLAFYALVMLSSCLLPWETAILLLISLFFVDGQGKVVWNYNPLARNIFDLMLGICVIKNFIKNKKIFNAKKIPKIILAGISLHFIWYTFQFFNIDNVGFIGVLACTKIYIFPMLCFIFYLNNPLSDKDFDRIIILTTFIVINECFLTTFQMGKLEGHLYQMHPYYMKQTKGIFEQSFFRPFGTTHLPGGISTYLAFTLGLMFLRPIEGIFIKIFIYFAVLYSWVALLISQVRSAFVKHVMIAVLVHLVFFATAKHKVFNLVIAGILILGVAGFLMANPTFLEKTFPDIDFTRSENRIKILSAKNNENPSGRINFSQFLDIVSGKLTANPMGLGPGRTGAATSFSLDVIAKDQVYGLTASWPYENFIISLVIDLGIGVFFYCLILFGITVYILGNLYYSLKHNMNNIFRLNLVCLSQIIVFYIGNWGAVGLTYNPESFLFWLFSALAIGSIDRNKIELMELDNL